MMISSTKDDDPIPIMHDVLPQKLRGDADSQSTKSGIRSYDYQ